MYMYFFVYLFILTKTSNLFFSSVKFLLLELIKSSKEIFLMFAIPIIAAFLRNLCICISNTFLLPKFLD